MTNSNSPTNLNATLGRRCRAGSREIPRRYRQKRVKPYVLHCLRVMHGVNDPLAKQVAVMHDLVEDTDVTFDELRTRRFCSFPLSKRSSWLLTTYATVYAEYVIRLKPNELARQV